MPRLEYKSIVNMPNNEGWNLWLNVRFKLFNFWSFVRFKIKYHKNNIILLKLLDDVLLRIKRHRIFVDFFLYL